MNILAVCHSDSKSQASDFKKMQVWKMQMVLSKFHSLTLLKLIIVFSCLIDSEFQELLTYSESLLNFTCLNKKNLIWLNPGHFGQFCYVIDEVGHLLKMKY